MSTQQLAKARDDGLVAAGVRGHLKFFCDVKGFGFIRTIATIDDRDQHDIFFQASEKDKVPHLKAWQSKSIFDNISLENPLEFDLQPSSMPGKPPVAVNLRAVPVLTRYGGGSDGAKSSPRGSSDLEDSQIRVYRKQLVEHVVARHKVERLRADELLRQVPGEMLQRVVANFDKQIKSKPGSQSPAALLGTICNSVCGGASPLSAAGGGSDTLSKRLAGRRSPGHGGTRPPAEIACRFYPRCRKGDHCPFRHDPAALRPKTGVQEDSQLVLRGPQPNESPVKPPGWREGDPL